jgi:hypothetical protein
LYSGDQKIQGLHYLLFNEGEFQALDGAGVSPVVSVLDLEYDDLVYNSAFTMVIETAVYKQGPLVFSLVLVDPIDNGSGPVALFPIRPVGVVVHEEFIPLVIHGAVYERFDGGEKRS